VPGATSCSAPLGLPESAAAWVTVRQSADSGEALSPTGASPTASTRREVAAQMIAGDAPDSARVLRFEHRPVVLFEPSRQVFAELGLDAALVLGRPRHGGRRVVDLELVGEFAVVGAAPAIALRH
jgi:hypothetical protein